MIEIKGFRDGKENLVFTMRLEDSLVNGHKLTHWYNGYWHGDGRPLKSWAATWREIDLLFGDALRDSTEVKVNGEAATKEEGAKYVLDLLGSVGRDADVERLKKKDALWRTAQGASQAA